MVYHAEFGLVDSPANPDEFELTSGAGPAIARLNQLGLPVIVVSNQPGIAKGKFTRSLLEAMELKMTRAIAAAGGRIDRIYNCLHHPDAIVDEFRVRCDCRKPAAGLLRKGAGEFNIDLAGSYMVGDGVTDIAAARAAGALTTIFVNARRCYNCELLTEHGVWPDYVAGDLVEAASVIEHLERGDEASASIFALNCAAIEAHSNV
jgi:D-glycero-D-manno-heptose 1,7-bisphosphate phosphatase